MPLVPVTGFWSTERSISRASLAAAIAGAGKRPRTVFVAAPDLAPLAAALGVRPGPNVRAVSPANVRAALAKAPDALGILRAGDVTPAVRALAVGGLRLFGGARVRDLAAWPLLVAEPAGAAPSAFDPAATWTLAAGGDVMLDREVYRLAVLEGKGADYPWDGGTARITGRSCCGYPGWEIVSGRRTGHAGAVRALLRGADVALVNLEAPAPDAPTYHPTGYVFTMDPRLLAGVDRAGIDVVSLANNHIGNAGAAGVVQTVRNLDRRGIAHAGAGRNLAAARRPAWLAAGGLRIAVLAYDGAGGRHATRTVARGRAAPPRRHARRHRPRPPGRRRRRDRRPALGPRVHGRGHGGAAPHRPRPRRRRGRPRPRQPLALGRPARAGRAGASSSTRSATSSSTSSTTREPSRGSSPS